MIVIKQLTNSDAIEEASALLYKIYIEKMKWNFSPNNPSKLRVVKRKNRKLLIDRFTEKAIWFGAFDDDELISCARLCGVDENNKLEIEGYASSKPILPPVKLAVSVKEC